MRKILLLLALFSFNSFATSGINLGVTYKNISLPNAFFVVKGVTLRNTGPLLVRICGYQNQATFNLSDANDFDCQSVSITIGAQARQTLMDTLYTAILNQISYFSGGSAAP